MTGTAGSVVHADAARCFLCLCDPQAEPAARRHWQHWLEADPAHRRAFDACRRAWAASTHTAACWPTRVELAADRYSGEEAIAASVRVGDYCETASVRHHPHIRRALAAAALLVLSLAAPLRLSSDGSDLARVYATGRGEQRRLTLADGSSVMLAPESMLRVAMLPTERTFRLVAGEAIFTAAHDPTRPFRVYAGGGWVDDIGTSFDVRSGGEGVTVTVVQGTVEVVSPVAAGFRGSGTAPRIRLERNQQVSFGDRAGPVRTVDASLSMSWREGLLSYVDAPLSTVVADLRRYSMKDIVVEGGAVDRLSFTGSVSITQLDQWATGLSRVYPVQARLFGDRIVLAPARR